MSSVSIRKWIKFVLRIDPKNATLFPNSISVSAMQFPIMCTTTTKQFNNFVSFHFSPFVCVCVCSTQNFLLWEFDRIAMVINFSSMMYVSFVLCYESLSGSFYSLEYVRSIPRIWTPHLFADTRKTNKLSKKLFDDSIHMRRAHVIRSSICVTVFITVCCCCSCWQLKDRYGQLH